MVVSYETLRSLQDELAGCPVGLLLADEGHRLKNSGKLLQPLMSLLTFRLANVSGAQHHQCAASGHSVRHAHPGKSSCQLVNEADQARTICPSTSPCSTLRTQNILVRASTFVKTSSSRFSEGEMLMRAKRSVSRVTPSSKSWVDWSASSSSGVQTICCRNIVSL